MWPFSNERVEVRKRIAGLAPDEVIDRLLDGRQASLTPSKREVTIFFSDLDHIPLKVEKFELETLLRYLTEFNAGIDKCIRRNGGIVDKVFGDNVMALWNAPEDNPNHQLSACLAAIDCQEFIARFGKEFGVQDLGLRIGINTGEVVAGLFPFGSRRHYTAFGDEVNIASRLEGINRFFRTKTLVGEATYREAGGGVVGRPLGRIRMLGPAEPIRVFELVGRKDALPPAWGKALPLFAEALDRYDARRFGEAREAFRGVLTLVPDDGPARLYEAAAADFEKEPPPDGWDAVFNITTR